MTVDSQRLARPSVFTVFLYVCVFFFSLYRNGKGGSSFFMSTAYFAMPWMKWWVKALLCIDFLYKKSHVSHCLVKYFWLLKWVVLSLHKIKGEDFKHWMCFDSSGWIVVQPRIFSSILVCLRIDGGCDGCIATVLTPGPSYLQQTSLFVLVLNTK